MQEHPHIPNIAVLPSTWFNYIVAWTSTRSSHCAHSRTPRWIEPSLTTALFALRYISLFASRRGSPSEVIFACLLVVGALSKRGIFASLMNSKRPAVVYCSWRTFLIFLIYLNLRVIIHKALC